MKTSDLHWAAGLLEGEGYFGASKQTSPVVSCAMTDFDVIARLAAIFGVGSVTANPKPGHQDVRVWTACGSRAAQVMMTIWPLVGERRQRRITTTLLCWRSAPLPTQHRLRRRTVA